MAKANKARLTLGGAFDDLCANSPALWDLFFPADGGVEAGLVVVGRRVRGGVE